jgi:hypothetical protein
MKYVFKEIISVLLSLGSGVLRRQLPLEFPEFKGGVLIGEEI